MTHRIFAGETVAALAAASMFLAGCLETRTVAGVDAAEEIRIDAFSLTWRGDALNADEVRGDTLEWPDFRRVLLDGAHEIRDLPAHVLDTSEWHGVRMLFAAKRPPGIFACQLRRTGRIDAWEGPAEDVPDPAYADIHDIEGIGAAITIYTRTPLAEWMPIGCSYIPGKGFWVRNFSDMMGEIVIRY